jgi:hypothetical protein
VKGTAVIRAGEATNATPVRLFIFTDQTAWQDIGFSMDEKQRAGINGKAVSSLCMFFAFFLLIPSGILMHVFSSDQFEAHRHVFMTIHNICAIIFVVSALFHLVRYRKAVWSYMRRKTAGYRAFNKELILVVLIFAVLLGLGLLHIAILG